MKSPETLRQFVYFKGGTEDSLKTLSMVSEDVTFKAGDAIFKQGEPAEYLYVLTRGDVEIRYPLSSGEQRVVDRLGQGDLLAWSAVVEPYTNTAFGIAVSDCEAVAVDGARLRQLMREDGELYQCLMTALVKVVTSRLTGARRQLAKLD